MIGRCALVGKGGRMKKAAFLLCGSIFLLSGCVVRTYSITRDRVDQDLNAGNRGYLMGTAPQGEEKERTGSRTTQVVEVELRSPLKFEKTRKIQANTLKAETNMGNQGYVTGAPLNETESPVTFEKYTVEKNDTLQKISQKFYGTTKKWTKIFDANKDSLKTPNKIRPGQILNIPVLQESMKETKENLK